MDLANQQTFTSHVRLESSSALNYIVASLPRRRDVSFIPRHLDGNEVPWGTSSFQVRDRIFLTRLHCFVHVVEFVRSLRKSQTIIQARNVFFDYIRVDQKGTQDIPGQQSFKWSKRIVQV